MPAVATPFLMFEGRAREAIEFYVRTLPDAKLVEMRTYGPGAPGPEGTVMRAVLSFAGQTVRCTDSFVKHGFTFTPALSFFLDCESIEQIEQLFARLSDGGGVLMPLGSYGFSRRFGWLNDRFGVSWQLNLP
jgi:predicted 3-demethylubiquinone-9 3-methyltransferase (glyoxalase superfamily)